jgi:hypothetical protein
MLYELRFLIDPRSLNSPAEDVAFEFCFKLDRTFQRIRFNSGWSTAYLDVERTYILKFSPEDAFVEWLHDVFVCTRIDCFCNVFKSVFSGAENDSRLIALRFFPNHFQERNAIHDRHIPIKKNDIRHRLPAFRQSFLAVFSFIDFEAEPFDDPPRKFPNDTRIVDY